MPAAFPDGGGDARPVPHPLVIFLVAQPGSGKSRVARQLAAAFEDRGGFIDVDSDRNRPWTAAEIVVGTTRRAPTAAPRRSAWRLTHSGSGTGLCECRHH
ncbi:zeta toxin family protein [Frankia sp. Cr1]|uniref:zeta toxin family protein n=1 Tax=Frankia sp. Cr1 TaxID=3073931 RepID=UPI003A101E65